jgi:uncharacterized protein
MQRSVEKDLKKWFDALDRRPLLVRGARQVGKSYTIRMFGKDHFSNTVEVNFEQHPEFSSCFETLVPTEIIDRLSILTRQNIQSGKTLLFLDEIQKCPPALTSLRYFYEQLPELHVIAAGSLLDFTLTSDQISVPVGRVQYLYMKPMSFAEFLAALGENNARSFIADGDLAKTGTAIHQRLISLVNKYMVVGGMPSAVKAFIEHGAIASCVDIQTSITQTFRDDFGKYAKKAKQAYIEKTFVSSATMAGRRYKYSHVDPDAKSRDLKDALYLLERAGVVFRVRATSGAGLPLEAEADEKTFKTLFLDVGLMQNICGLTEDTLFAKDLLGVYAGALAEQFVGQEFIAYQDPLRAPQLFFWTRKEPGSTAEVDYLYPHGSTILPVEVKAGTTGMLRSAHLFLAKYKRSPIIKISQSPFSFVDRVLCVPLYAIGEIPRLLRLRS